MKFWKRRLAAGLVLTSALAMSTYAVTQDAAGSGEPTSIVTIPPVTTTVPGATVTLPLATVTLPSRTITVQPSPISVPLPTELITIPGPVVTKHATNTVTVHSSAAKTVFEPSKTKTVVITKIKTRTVKVLRNSTVNHTDTIINKILFTTFLGIGFAILALIGMLFAYWAGRNDQKKNEKKFLGTLLDKVSRM